MATIAGTDIAGTDESGSGRRPHSAWLLSPRRTIWARFLLVGASGLIVNQLALILLTETTGFHYVVAAVAATLASSTWNFALADRWAFGDRSRTKRSAAARYAAFLALNFALLPARGPILVGLTELGGLHYAWSNAISLIVLTIVRLAFADQWVWRERRVAASEAPVRDEGATSDRPTRYRYDIAGLLTIHSDVVLPEVAYFRTEATAPPDIRITVGFVAPRPTTRVRFEEDAGQLVYREHLGPIAANFSLKMGDPIEIRVSPVLAISPHVVYTNIVEALLRFRLVSKGHVLLHSAAIVDAAGRATLLSAQTDTGKTSTVITLIRSRGYRFLSDDMTIIDAAAGDAISYPKPMTLSFHTMGVAKDGHLTVRDRAALAIQSRLHSKSGREVGRSLGKLNIPIMTINSIVQAVVPPPKHRIEALFECEVGGRAPIRNVVLMQRGEEVLEELLLEETVRRLIENTDDAYGFPPFSTFAPRIRIGDLHYAALCRREAELLATALRAARRWHLQVPGHDWARLLPSIIERDLDPVAVGPGSDEPELVPVGPGFAVEREPAVVPVLLSTVTVPREVTEMSG